MELRDAPAEGWPERADVRVEIDGASVPLAIATLAEAARVRSQLAAIVWKDPQVRLQGVPDELGRGETLLHGPGQVALSRGQPGTILALPLPAGAQIAIGQGALVLATGGVRETDRMELWGLERGMRTYQARGEEVLLLQSRGSLYAVALDPDECIDVAPGALLAAEPAVSLELIGQRLGSDPFGAPVLTLLRCGGPGRLWIQSLPDGD